MVESGVLVDWVRIPTWTWLGFFRFSIAVNLFLLGVGLFLNNVLYYGAYSSFIFPVSYHHLPFLLLDCLKAITSKSQVTKLKF